MLNYRRVTQFVNSTMPKLLLTRFRTGVPHGAPLDRSWSDESPRIWCVYRYTLELSSTLWLSSCCPPRCEQVPSGYVKIAIRNGPFISWCTYWRWWFSIVIDTIILTDTLLASIAFVNSPSFEWVIQVVTGRSLISRNLNHDQAPPPSIIPHHTTDDYHAYEVISFHQFFVLTIISMMITCHSKTLLSNLLPCKTIVIVIVDIFAWSQWPHNAMPME